MSEWGFGSPTYTKSTLYDSSGTAITTYTSDYYTENYPAGAPVPEAKPVSTYFDYDWGFGATTDTTELSGTTPSAGTLSAGDYVDTYFGSPTMQFLIPPLIFLQAHSRTEIPDKGGTQVSIFTIGDWNPSVTYQIALYATGSTTVSPSTDTYAYAGKRGQGSTVKPDSRGNFLRFIVPPLPPGTYDIHITSSEDTNMPKVVTAAFKVVRRSRNFHVYKMRNRCLDTIKTGPRSQKSEKLFNGGL